MLYAIKHIITILVIVISLGMTQCVSAEQKQAPQIPLDKLQQGDIAFRRGEGFISEVVVYNDANATQVEVDAAKAALVKAEKGLIVKPDPTVPAKVQNVKISQI